MTQHANRIAAPPYSPSKIIQQAHDFMHRYFKIVGIGAIDRRGIRFQELYETTIYPDHEIEIVEGEELGTDKDGKKVLGFYDVTGNTVFIDKEIGPHSDDPRRTFTLHHEVLGHGVLQGAWLRRQVELQVIPEFLVTTEDSIDATTERALEQQANLFAANTSAPRTLVKRCIWQVYEREILPFCGPSEYDLSPYGVRRRHIVESRLDLCRLIASQIQKPWFDRLSIESLGYRVAESGCVARDNSLIKLHRAVG